MNKTILPGVLGLLAVSSPAAPWSAMRAAYELAAAGGHAQQHVAFVLDSENGNIRRERVAFDIPVPVEGIDYPFQPRPLATDAADVDELDAISDALERTMIEDVHVLEASLLDVLRVLQEACDEQNPPDRRVTFAKRHRVGLEMQVVPVREIRDAALRPDQPRITLSANRISAARLLRDVLDKTRATHHALKGGVVVVRSWVWDCCNYVHRLYAIAPHTEDVLLRAGPEDYQPVDRLKDCLALLGAGLRADASLQYLSGIGELLAWLTEQEHARLERALRLLEEPPLRPGRFRLHGPAAGTHPGDVFLLDTDTGRTWRYRRKGDATEGLMPRMERFELVADEN